MIYPTRMTTSIVSFFLMLGCATPDPEIKILKQGSISVNEKSMTLPSVGDGLFEIKEGLLQNGWKFKIENASIQEKGTNNQNIDTERKMKFDTAYRLYMTSTMSTNDNHGITTFNLTVVDNKTNQEIINMAGARKDYVRYSPVEIAKNLMAALKEIEK